MRRLHVVTVVGALMLGCAPCVAHAQAAPFTLPVGERVMLQYKDTVRLVPIGFNRHKLVGVLLSDSGAAYRLRLPTGDSVSVRHAAVTGAWRTLGVSRARSAFALGFGTAISGAFLAIGRHPTSRERWIGAAVGAGAGALLGIVRPTEMWRRVRR